MLKKREDYLGIEGEFSLKSQVSSFSSSFSSSSSSFSSLWIKMSLVVTGTGQPDNPCGLVLYFDHRRILIDCPEGTQRLLIQHKAPFSPTPLLKCSFSQ